MKYLIILCMLVSSCSVFRKSVNTVRNEASKSSITITDSTGRTTLDSTAIRIISGWKTITFDSGYDKVTEEIVKEVIDSNSVRRETARVIKEKGQKRVEQLSSITGYDSSSKKVDQQAAVKEVQKHDSAGVTVTQQKDVNRKSFMPWWIWLIIAGVAVLGWWQRNPIMEFLLSNKKAR